jgi:hypothetical protein
MCRWGAYLVRPAGDVRARSGQFHDLRRGQSVGGGREDCRRRGIAVPTFLMRHLYQVALANRRRATSWLTEADPPGPPAENAFCSGRGGYPPI